MVCAQVMKKRAKGNVVDYRFEGIFSDPRFDSLSTKRKKVVIDERFKDALKSKKFQARNAVDMRGRRLNLGFTNDLNSLYLMESDDEEEVLKKLRSKKKTEANSCDIPKTKMEMVMEDSRSEQGSDSDGSKIKLDLARGIGNILSSDEDSVTDDGFDSKDDEEEHNWGELDKEAKHVNWISKRLALCNMDWDQVNASDIFVLLQSFKPQPPASILSVTIYISNFGKKRLIEEEKSGPKLSKLKKYLMDEEEAKTREVFRSYQLERMRYYYAIIDCDSPKTASVLYDSCDGIEFESSAVRLDLRFVSDETSFEDCDVKECVTEEMVDLKRFKPKTFETNALSKSNTKLTWDENDPQRIKIIREAFNPAADLDDFQNALIAPCSSDEENSEVDGKNIKLLLDEAKFSRELKPVNGLEITWEPPTGDTMDANIVKAEVKKNSAPTPWESYLQKRKERRKERKRLAVEMRKNRRIEIQEGNECLKYSNSIVKRQSLNRSNEDDNLIDDKRFSALYSNSAFAIDQTNPLYKVTKLINIQVEAKRKVISEEKGDDMRMVAEKLKKKIEWIKKQ